VALLNQTKRLARQSKLEGAGHACSALFIKSGADEKLFRQGLVTQAVHMYDKAP
jgi:hypothetical protein